MRIICLSDSHGQHRGVPIPPGDVVIHAGDVSKRGEKGELADFLDWFGGLPHRYKIFVGGNHDFLLEDAPREFAKMVPDNCMYLNDSGVEIAGITVWGSPITPFFFDWAFNRHRGADIRRHWDLIPARVDILVTHGPPYGILDRTARGQCVGCEELLPVVERLRPRLHVFGHIHEAYGQFERNGTRFVNASVLDLHYRRVNAPVVVDFG
jgi:Icc-related predicted phosphoesterase